jgi:hypothetical protein
MRSILSHHFEHCQHTACLDSIDWRWRLPNLQLELRFKKRNRPLQACFELDLGFPAERLFCQADVGFSLSGIG